MSALTLKLRFDPSQRLDLSALTPGALSGSSTSEIEKISLSAGNDRVHVGDVFHVSGTCGDTLVIAGGSSRLDFIGAKADGGTIIVEGDTGAYCGQKMLSGRLEIQGNAGAYLASSLQDGLVVVSGSVDDYLGAPIRGDRDGISGGNVVVKGDVGDLAGTRMRRGTLIVNGKIGSHAGARMMGGTIWGVKEFGASPGAQMRRGMLIAPKMDTMLATFVDCGFHDLGILNIMSRHLQKTLGELAPTLASSRVHKFAGDMASVGKGEVLLTA